MKVFVLFALLAIVSCQANLTGLDCDQLPQKAALQRLLNIDFLSDVTRADFCGTEFSAYGTCCEPASLKAAAARLNDSIIADVRSIKIEYAEFSAAVAQVNAQLITLGNQKNQPDDAKANTSITNARNLRDSNAMSFLLSNFANSNTQKQNFNNSMDKCWGSVSNARSSALCAVCSGRSPAFVSTETVAGAFQVVVSDDDCQTVTDNCQDALVNMRALAQGVELYVNHLSPILLSSVQIYTDNQKVDAVALSRLNKIMATESYIINLNGTHSSNKLARAELCSDILSAGKPTLMEAFSEVFVSDMTYEIINLNKPISAKISEFVGQTDDLEDLLNTGFEYGTPAVEKIISDGVKINQTLQAVASTINSLSSHRRSLAQIGTFVSSSSLQQYINQLRASVSGQIADVLDFSVTPLELIGGGEFGAQVDQYIGDQASVIAESRYSALTFGARPRNYIAPAANNAPAFVYDILDPITFTPLNLNIPRP